MEKTLPGFDKIVEKVLRDFYARLERLEKKEAEKKEARKRA